MDQIAIPLFLPATRLDRLAKAANSGADAVILDLEDAVAPAGKKAARDGLMASLQPGARPLLVRINSPGTPWHAEDVTACRALPIQGVMLAKAETSAECREVAVRSGKPVMALIETARGLANAVDIAASSDRLAFGSIDYAADLGMAHVDHALLHARSALVQAARLAGQAAPLDGVTTDLHDEARITADSRHAQELGFGGKLVIHPAQIAPARRGFAPSLQEVDWAKRVCAAAKAQVGNQAENQTGAIQLDGAMIDAPVIKRAESILRRAKANDLTAPVA